MPRSSLVDTIIGINVVVFILWFLAGSGVVIPYSPFLNFMVENFLVSWRGLIDGRLWTLLTSVFSHNAFFHLLLNMYVLKSFGPVLEGVLGPLAFLKFYLVAGVISSVFHALVSAFVIGDPALSALGASGAISGLILVFSLLFPRAKLLFLGFIPVRALVGALLFIGLDLWGLVVQAEGGGLPIGHGAHLGGALTGVVYYFWKLRPNLVRSS